MRQQEEKSTVAFEASKKEEATKTVYTKDSNELSNAKSGTTAYTDLAKKAQDEMKLSDEDMSSYLSTLATNISTVNTYENTADTTLEDSNEYSRKYIRLMPKMRHRA